MASFIEETKMNTNDPTTTTPPRAYQFASGAAVQNIPNRGKGLIATTDLPAATILFSEPAVMFHRNNIHLDNVTCDCCGSWLLSEREQLQYALKRVAGVQQPPSNSNEILALLDPKRPVETPLTCEACHIRWCCVECQQSSMAAGHQFLCKQMSEGGKLRNFLAKHALERKIPSAAHFGCAARILAKVAMYNVPKLGSVHLKEHAPSEVNREEDLEYDASALLHTMDEIMGSFFQASFTVSLHATRTRSTADTSDNAMFTTHLQPAYRTAYLEEYVLLLRDNFAPLGVTFGATFLTVESLDRLMGIFATNNFAVEFESPLKRLNEYNPIYATWLKSSMPLQEFPTVRGTACLKHYAILNHSCSKNTAVRFNGGKGALRIAVELTENVAQGSEIFNSYLLNGATMDVSEREEELCQYLFQCTCSLCMRQRLERGDSSGGEDY
jgi:hypothetical protein